MSFPDFQRAATEIIRFNVANLSQEAVGAGVDQILRSYELSDKERSDLAFLAQDRLAGKYAHAMMTIRRRMVFRRLYLTAALVPDETLKIWFRRFDCDCAPVDLHHTAYAFACYILDHDLSDDPVLRDVFLYEKAQVYLRAYLPVETKPLAAESMATGRSFQVVQLSYDVPGWLAREKVSPEKAKTKPERRLTYVLLVKGNGDDVKNFEIDHETFVFLSEQLQDDPRPVPLPSTIADLRAMGLIR